MALIVPHQILEQVCCTECSLYLSVMPIKVYPNRKTKCGRCSTTDDGGAESKYETIFGNGVFHCVNRYNGCKALLKPQDVLAHEETCVGEKFDCPICFDLNESLYFIYKHLKTVHPECVLYKNKMEFNMADDDMGSKLFVYCENYTLFVINARFSSENGLFQMNITCFKKKSPKIPFNCTISSLSGGLHGKVKNIVGSEEDAVVMLTKEIKRFVVKFVLDIPNDIGILDSSVISNKITFRYDIKNFRSFLNKNTRVSSPTHFMDEIPLSLEVEISPDDNVKSFGLYLWIDKDETFKKKWSCQAKCVLKLISYLSDIENYSKDFDHLFNQKVKSSWGYANFKELFHILKPANGFIKDNTVTVEAEVTIDYFKFDE